MGDKKTILEKIKANKVMYFTPLILLPLSSDNVQYTPLKITPQDQAPKEVDEFAMFRGAEQEIFALIALTEDCRMKSYSCGIRETIGLGSTLDLDGNFIEERTILTSVEDAKALAQAHIEKRIYPQILKFVDYKRLNNQQLAAFVCAFYNLGSETLTGYNEKMEKVGEPSELVKSINSGVDLKECANRFMGYCRAGGKSCDGLKKRRYLEKHYFNGNISLADVLNMRVNGLYAVDPVSMFCAKKIGPKGYYVTKDDEATVNKFKEICSEEGGVKVAEMMKDLGFKLDYQTMPKDYIKTAKIANKGR